MKYIKIIFSVLLSITLLSSCSISKKEIKEKPVIAVSILPQKYFVEQIAGDLVNVEVIVKPGSNPATYSPTSSQMMTLAEAKLYFSIGVPFEKIWLGKIAKNNPNLKIIATQKGISLRNMESYKDFKNISKKTNLKNSQKDPHIWLSPELVEIQAKNIANALIAFDPKNKNLYLNNLNKFTAKLIQLHQIIKTKFSKTSHRTFLVFHPSWGYFANEFGLTQIPIQFEGKTPTSIQMEDIISFAQKNDIKTIFIQKQFNKKIAQSIAEQIGGKVLSIDPLAEDYYNNLINIADKMCMEMN